jgi:hypothetical protein
MSYVEPPPYPEVGAPLGGEPIDLHTLLGVHGKRMVRRWRFEGRDPHHSHYLYLRGLPDGRFAVEPTADRWHRVWLYPTQAQAEAAAEAVRGALVWPGEWLEISPD